MNSIFTYATVAYAAVFLSMGAVLLSGYVPRDRRMVVYRSARRVFGCAYLLLGVTGVTDLVFGVNVGRDYVTLYIMPLLALSMPG